MRSIRQQQILDSYDAKAKQKGLQNVRMFLEEDDAAKRIMEIANEGDCGLLLMGSRGRVGFKELLLGSVSHKIANHSDRPVLIVK
jgi:nucleotide-binding universal stress UspA family protein